MYEKKHLSLLYFPKLRRKNKLQNVVVLCTQCVAIYVAVATFEQRSHFIYIWIVFMCRTKGL